MAALGVGLAATALPTMLAYGMTAKDSRAEDIGLFVGPAIGLIAGPAVGLWSGDRADEATDGLVIRTATTAICFGALGLAGANWDSSQDLTTSIVLGIIGVSAGLVTAGSVVRDLAITPSATAEVRGRRTQVILRPDGTLALSVRF